MANYEIPANPTYNGAIRKLENTDPANAETVFNPLLSQMIVNTAAVKKEIPKNLVDGNNTGTVRTIGARSNYTMGIYAAAEGLNTTASGKYSHVEGSGCIASGECAHAENRATTASGVAAHTEGSNTTASGENAHAEGLATTASGENSHAEGKQTKALKIGSHAEGLSATASGEYSHAEGGNTTASGYYAHAEGGDTTASGNYSHAEGRDTTASGHYAHAEGYNTTALGDYSHAEGYSNKVDGNFSHAEGRLTIALGEFAHTEGNASAVYKMRGSHAEGNGTIASYKSIVFKIAAVTAASRTIRFDPDYGMCKTIFSGITVGMKLYVRNISTSTVKIHEFTVNTINAADYSVTVTETIPTSYFTADYAVMDKNLSNEQHFSNHAEGYRTLSLGQGSHAEGGSATASGEYSHAEGGNTTASGDYSHAEGFNTIAGGIASHAEGNNTKALGQYSHTEGNYSVVAGYGLYSHAEGTQSIVVGMRGSHAEGNGTIATYINLTFEILETDAANKTFRFDPAFGNCKTAFPEITIGMKLYVRDIQFVSSSISEYTVKTINAEDYSITVNEVIPATNYRPDYAVMVKSLVTVDNYSNHAEGFKTLSAGQSSHSEGGRTVAAADFSHAEGYKTTVSGMYAHAEGLNTTALGITSHAEGSTTTAVGNYTHAEGVDTRAVGNGSHAEGYYTSAQGAYAHAGGYYTLANYIQYAIGHYNASATAGNTANTTGSAFVIGNGTSASALSNCFRVQYDGKTYAKGSYSSSGADYAELFEWEDGNPEKADRRGLFAALHGTKIAVAESPDDYILGIISANPAVLGNNHSETWKDMYLTDVWGDTITERKSFPAEYETIKHMELLEKEDGTIEEVETEEKILVREAYEGDTPVLNPDYDPEETYIPRHERPEWGTVGMMGQLLVYDDGSCQPKGFCTVTAGGKATKADTGWYVMERVDKNLIRVLFK